MQPRLTRSCRSRLSRRPTTHMRRVHTSKRHNSRGCAGRNHVRALRTRAGAVHRATSTCITEQRAITTHADQGQDQPSTCRLGRLCIRGQPGIAQSKCPHSVPDPWLISLTLTGRPTRATDWLYRARNRCRRISSLGRPRISRPMTGWRVRAAFDPNRPAVSSHVQDTAIGVPDARPRSLTTRNCNQPSRVVRVSSGRLNARPPGLAICPQASWATIADQVSNIIHSPAPGNAASRYGPVASKLDGTGIRGWRGGKASDAVHNHSPGVSLDRRGGITRAAIRIQYAPGLRRRGHSIRKRDTIPVSGTKKQRRIRSRI